MDAFIHEWGGNDGRHHHQGGRQRAITTTTPIGIRKVSIERRHHHHDQPGTRFFFERNQVAEVYSVSLKRKTFLMGFLAIICRFAMIDTMNVLPCGLLIYAVEIPYAIELLTSSSDGGDETTEFSRWIDNLFGFVDVEEQEREAFEVMKRERVLAAQFEYHVVKGRPNVKIVPIRNKFGTVSILAVG